MKNNFLKLLSLFLAIVTLSLMVSCDLSSIMDDIAPDDLGNGVNNDTVEGPKFTLEDTEQASEEETEEETEKESSSETALIHITSLDFEGQEVSVILSNSIAGSREWYKEESEDELDEAVALRNQAVCDTLDITLRFEIVRPITNNYETYLHNTIINDISTGLHYYDISNLQSNYTASSNIRDCAANLLDEDVFPYFNFSLPCWNQSLIENTTVNGRLFYVAGDANISVVDAAYVIWHNKTLYDRYKEPTDLENMQDVALAGQWTYEELFRWTSVFYEDSNGEDGKQADDTYALLVAQSSEAPFPIDAFPYAWDISFVTTKNDGTHEFNIVGNEKANTALEKCRTLLRGQGTYATSSAHVFAGGTAMFYMERLYSGYDANMAIREMDDMYGLLPIPKYDLKQADYKTTAHNSYNLTLALNHSTGIKGEAVSAFLELANEESHISVRGYYLNRIIKPKFFGRNDSEGTVTKSIALLDVILANLELDFFSVYSPQLNNFSWFWRNACLSETTETLESMYNTQKNNFDKAIYDTDMWFGLK